MRYLDIPDHVLNAAQRALAAPITPDASGNATIVRKPHRRVDDRATSILRSLRLATRPAGNRNTLLLHVWETYPDRIPPRQPTQSGPWQLKHLQVKPDINTMWYDQLTPSLHARLPKPRIIPILSREDQQGKQKIWMSTADLELATMSDSLEECSGHVLVAGLGLGVFPVLAIQKPDVKSVTVVEIDSDIMSISSQYVEQHGIKTFHSSIEEFAHQPPDSVPRFDYCFYDIWPYIQDPYAHEDEARATVENLMAPDATVSMWCQALNDRKRSSMKRIRQIGARTINLPQPGQTCYSCAEELLSSVDGLCIGCAIGTWRESPHLQGLDFPIQPDEVPEISLVRDAQRALASLDPDTFAELMRLNNRPVPA